MIKVCSFLSFYIVDFLVTKCVNTKVQYYFDIIRVLYSQIFNLNTNHIIIEFKKKKKTLLLPTVKTF